MKKFLVLRDRELNAVSGGVFHAYSARGVRNNYKSAVGPADWVISAVRGFIHG
ncbi:two-peptide bacteriocin plantaricin EF subunit PlnF [Lactiplantibacillus plantarum]|uniref:two-peptide bacteriocin plantaricin EF subunit PlnF n=1 Tax=Lactiplantibacillus plantarum TaxID=1590 RepID=UPI0007BB3CAE|nr:two-peptide bacteriocin plantaricin EF subunit PlnF [Lactiplantibacillus plantarum]AYE59368.1 two-peptide bacteriocin plantaricin EF subunit PlnF [Lactiplantibacillus plantarum]KZU48236.1 bacteriocin precursor peptide PlnF [Lactiplantibacillus plantarum]QBJ57035.1 two-peptide bacteriocin plantaricin EF subunit PlnF [Lactiplantibacillus plantarum]